jgi:IS5 family transposase
MTCPSLPSLTRWWAAMERLGDFLDRIEQGFDWSAFEALLSRLGDGRAPGYPPLTMFKIVLLQQWHTLSDPAAEEAVRDRLSFRLFGCLPLDMETPDHPSIWRFRQTIDKLGASAALLAEVNRQLDARGLVIKRGTLVDATLIAGVVRGPYQGGGVNPRDPEAHAQARQDLFRLQSASGGGRRQRSCAAGRDDLGQCP